MRTSFLESRFVAMRYDTRRRAWSLLLQDVTEAVVDVQRRLIDVLLRQLEYLRRFGEEPSISELRREAKTLTEELALLTSLRRRVVEARAAVVQVRLSA